MCPNHIICVEEDSASLVSSDSLLMLDQESTSSSRSSSITPFAKVQHTNSASFPNIMLASTTASSSSSISSSFSSEVHSVNSITMRSSSSRRSKSSCSFASNNKATTSSATTEIKIMYQEFQNLFQNKNYTNRIDSSNATDNSINARVLIAPSSNITSGSSGSSISSKPITSFHSSLSSLPQEKSVSSFTTTAYESEICNENLSYHLNTFLSKFTKEKEKEGRRKFATTLMLPIIANIFSFNHFVCFLTLFVIRFAAKIWAIKNNNDHSPNHAAKNQRIYTQEDSSKYNSYSSKGGGGGDYALSCTASGSALSYCSSSMLTTQHSFECDDGSSSTSTSKDLSSNPQNQSHHHECYADDNEDGATLSPANCIPIEASEDDNDEWGHFTDFEVDVGQSLKDSSPIIGAALSSSSITSSSSPSKNSRGDKGCCLGTIDDPFCSISKSMLRRRGHKLSVCKLEKLQENDEEEDD